MIMKAGFVQFTPIFGDREDNIRQIGRLLADVDAKLIVLPELCNTGYLFTSRQEVQGLAEEAPGGRTTDALCRMAREKDAYLVAGLIEKCAGKFFNASVLVGPAGHIATYRKIHLFYEETLWFDPGDLELAVHDIGICRVGMMICFDWYFPEVARILSLLGADVICHCANLVLPYCQEAMVTRCLENHVFAITANRTGTEERGGKKLDFTGKSQITDPDGAILFRAAEADEEVRVVEIEPERARDKRINAYNDLFCDRRTDHYRELTKAPIR
jgi:predicted amidohydrolase